VVSPSETLRERVRCSPPLALGTWCNWKTHWSTKPKSEGSSPSVLVNLGRASRLVTATVLKTVERNSLVGSTPTSSAFGKLVKLVLTRHCWRSLSAGHRRREDGTATRKQATIPSLPTRCPIAQWQSARLLTEGLQVQVLLGQPFIARSTNGRSQCSEH
jgi:hypothetical protein